MLGDHFHKRDAIAFELFLTDTRNIAKCFVGLRALQRHIGQRSVGENDVGRDSLFLRQTHTQLAQGLKQRLIHTAHFHRSLGGLLGRLFGFRLTAQSQVGFAF